MPKVKQRLYCYVDESGQDTLGRLFVVSVVISSRDVRDRLEKDLERIEKQSGKRKKRWQETKFKQRIVYLENIIQLKELRHHLFAARYETTKEYESLTTYTIAQAVNTVTKDGYRATIVIDGLNPTARQRVMRDLRKLKITYNKVVGGRDQSSALLRLADALAGLMRDYWEGDVYATTWEQKLVKGNMLIEL